MLKENNEQEKICLFYASDYHFEMISLPYINDNLKKNKDIIVVTENDLDKTVDELLSKLNLKQEEKNKIKNIDWKNNDLNKFKRIKNANKKGKDTIIFVKGKVNYINNINKNINNWINVSGTKVINCYDISEVEKNICDITKQYNEVLVTNGIEKLK